MSALNYARAKGFTLAELVVVILVIAVTAAIVLPKQQNDELLLASQAEQLASDIRYAQSLSMSQGKRYLLRVLSTTTYEFESAGGTQIPHPTGIPSPITLGAGITMSVNPTSGTCTSGCLGFDGLGIPYTDLPVSSALTAPGATITLSKNSIPRTIAISPETGRVIVQ